MLDVRVTPNARFASVRFVGGVFAVRVAAPAIDGKANEAARRFLAELLGVPRRSVVVVAGVASRRKRFRVADVEQAEAERRLHESCE